jgi:hypothetical protein
VNPDQSPEPLEAQLRALPRPPVPAGLEARLLAAIPPEILIPRRRWTVRIGVLAGLAAACVLAVLAWPRTDSTNPTSDSGKDGAVAEDFSPPPAPHSAEDSNGLAAWREARRVREEPARAAFTWPLEETSPLRASTALAPDLLD